MQVLGLKRVHLVDPAQYPSFTLVRQAWGSLKLGLEALTLMVPEVSSLSMLALQVSTMQSTDAVYASSTSGLFDQLVWPPEG